MQFGELAYGGGDVIETMVDGAEVDPRALLDHGAERGDLRFEALDLAGLADGARKQFDHMGELLHLAGDLADAAMAVALGLELAFEPLEPTGEAGNEGGEFAEFRVLAGATADTRAGRRHLPTADFGDRPGQGIGLVIGHGVALTEPVNRTLDRPQGLAPPDSRLGTTLDTFAQGSHPLRQPVHRRFRTLVASVAVLDLIEQRHQFAAQRLPLAPGGVARNVQRLRIEVGAGHGWPLCIEWQPSRLHEGMRLTVEKTW